MNQDMMKMKERTKKLFSNDNFSVFLVEGDLGRFIEICDGKIHFRYIEEDGTVVIEREPEKG